MGRKKREEGKQMNDERDPLDDLQDLWAQLDAPEITEDIEDCDGITQQVVTNLRDIYMDLDPDEVAATRTQKSFSPPWRIVAAIAAGLLLLFFVPKLELPGIKSGVNSSNQTADVAETQARNSAADQTQDKSAPTKDTHKQEITTEFENGRLVFVSGNVRLMLVNGSEEKQELKGSQK